MSKIITAITGASGSIYAKRLIQVLNESGHHQTILVSNPAVDVLKHELGISLSSSNEKIEDIIVNSWNLAYPEGIHCEDVSRYHSTIASGSAAAEAMVVIPCSMGSIARFSQGISSNLIERSFDVMLKEKRKVIVVPRETPLNQIHLRNLLDLAQLGVDIIPAMPAFYHQPKNIQDVVDFVVGRVLEHLGIEHSLYKKWSGLGQ